MRLMSEEDNVVRIHISNCCFYACFVSDHLSCLDYVLNSLVSLTLLQSYLILISVFFSCV